MILSLLLKVHLQKKKTGLKKRKVYKMILSLSCLVTLCKKKHILTSLKNSIFFVEDNLLQDLYSMSPDIDARRPFFSFFE